MFDVGRAIAAPGPPEIEQALPLKYGSKNGTIIVIWKVGFMYL